MDELYNVLSLKKWKKKKEILSELKSQGIVISERKFRKYVEKNNNMYGDGVTDYYIAHSNKGYKITFDWEEVELSIKDKRKRALTMLAECSKCERQFQRRNNLRMEEIL